MKQSMKLSFTGYEWQLLSESSDYSYTAIRQWSSTKSTKTGTVPKKTWVLTALKSENSKKHFQGLEILHVLRDSNIAADILAKLGSNRAKVPPGVFIEELSAPSIKQPGEITPELPAKGTQILVITTSWT